VGHGLLPGSTEHANRTQAPGEAPQRGGQWNGLGEVGTGHNDQSRLLRGRPRIGERLERFAVTSSDLLTDGPEGESCRCVVPGGAEGI
jgi:hypothetical protein